MQVATATRGSTEALRCCPRALHSGIRDRAASPQFGCFDPIRVLVYRSFRWPSPARLDWHKPCTTGGPKECQ